MKGNDKVAVGAKKIFPQVGPVFNCYIFIHLTFQIITAFVLPFRLAFLPEIEYWTYVYLDFVTDFVFLCVMIIRFNTPIYEESRIVFDRKRIAKKYLKFWFWIDFYCLIPLYYFRMKSMSRPRSPDNVHNFLTLNFKSLPRFYPMLVIVRMTRIRGIQENFHIVLKWTNYKVPVQNIIISMFWVFFIMHICGCFLMAGAYFNLYTPERWTRSVSLIDAPAFEQFVCAIYWSCVTVSTVGYGDITQTNPFELLFVFFIMIFGVGFFVTKDGELSTNFSEMTQSSKAQQDRINQVHDLD